LGYNQEFRERSSGPVAQLGARLNGIQEVNGSIPVRSTNSLATLGRRRTLTVLRQVGFALRARLTGSIPVRSITPNPNN
jgi:hypothetical protein